MNFLFDTNVVSEATRPQPNAMVIDWIAAQNAESLFISAITLGELQCLNWKGSQRTRY